MKLIDELRACVMSGDPLVVVRSNDHNEATLNLIELCQQHGWALMAHKPNVGLIPDIRALTAYVATGSTADKPAEPHAGKTPLVPGLSASQPQAPPSSPQAVIASLRAFHESPAPVVGGSRRSAVLLLHNVHRNLAESMALTHHISDCLAWLKSSGKTVVILVHKGAKIPDELDPYCHNVQHAEPDTAELRRIISDIRVGDDDHQDDEQLEKAAVSVAGLTRQQAESAAARCIMRNGKLVPSELWCHKVELFNHDGLVRVHRPTAGLGKLGGLGFYRQVLAGQLRKGRLPKVLSVGPPGCGKSAGAFALGFEFGLNVLEARLGVLFGKYVGESEARTRAMQEIIEMNSPCIVVMDELPRYLSTDGGSSAEGGGGVNAKVGAEWLTWLSSKRAENVMIVATANEWSGIRTLTRAGRFDFKTYTSIASSPEKLRAIWDIHLDGFGHRDAGSVDADTYAWLIDQSTFWTGAEIEAICKFSSAAWLDEPIVETVNRIGISWDSPADRAALQAMEETGRNSSFMDIETGYKFSRVEPQPAPQQPAAGQARRRVRRN